MRVAARENGIPLSKMSDIEATLVDLMVTSKKSESAKLAISVHSYLSLNQKGTSGHAGTGWGITGKLRFMFAPGS